MEALQVPAGIKSKLLSLSHAINGWEAASQLLLEIKRRQLEPSHGMFEGLMAGACVFYGRPFKKANGLVRLDELATFEGSRNAQQWKEIHRAALDARDIVLAHQDVGKWAALPRRPIVVTPPDEITITFAPDGIRFENASLLPPANLHELLPLLINFQTRRADGLRFQIVAKYWPPGSVSLTTYRIEAVTPK
jgi:hypothetical protein